jgi:hypothetical protein
MHNCKATIERATEFLLDHPDGPNDFDVNGCEECRDEFDALKETLRVTTRLLEATAPPETFWRGYHARLSQKLKSPTPQHSKIISRSWFKKLFATSIRVPVPIGIAALLMLAVPLGLAIRISGKQTAAPSVSFVNVPVVVPVIQERTVTRVVYRQARRKAVISSPRTDSTLAKSQKPADEMNSVSLIGFKPLEEVKLKVIKGGTPDEK